MLYRKRHDSLKKVAGTKISSSPSQWNVEVMKTLKNEHPYVSTDQAEVKMDRLDTEANEATGRIILQDKLAVPFSIGENNKTGQTEIDPLDILFVPGKGEDDGELCHFSESAYKQSLKGEAVGRPFPSEDEDDVSRIPPGNEYIGDMTGDVSPLQYRGHPGVMSTAGCGLLSCVVRDEDQISRLHHIFQNNRGVNRSASRLGLHDALDNIQAQDFESPENTPFVQIRKKDGGRLVIDYPNGETKPVSAIDLKESLPSKHEGILQKVMSRGWAILRNFPTIKTPEVPTLNTQPTPIEGGGWYEVASDGGSKPAIVCPMMLDFDGQVIRDQMAVCKDNSYDRGNTFCGTPIKEPKRDHPAGDSSIKPGKEGVFLKESFGSCQMTPRVKIDKVLTPPDEPPILIGARMDTLESIGLVLVDALTRPEEISDTSFEAALPDNSYWMPSAYRFIEVDGQADLLDEAERESKGTEDDRPMARLKKNANWYSIHGKTVRGEVKEHMLSENDMRLKLAELSADDEAIDRACRLDNDDSIKLRGLRPCKFRVRKKEASVDGRKINELRQAGKRALDGYNEWMKTANAEEQEDPQTLDAILSLQFVSDDSLRDIVESKQIFREVEDKLARLLLASRRGQGAIHEKGVQRALQGMGEARKTLKTLDLELKSQEQ